MGSLDFLFPKKQPEDADMPDAGSSQLLGAGSMIPRGSVIPHDQPSPNDLMVNKADLEKAAKQKRTNQLIGGLTDALSNNQSFGNFFLGHMNPKHSMSDQVKAWDEQADQPISTKMQLQKQTEEAPKVQMSKDVIDPNSKFSQGKAIEMRATLNGMVRAKLMDQESADKMSSSLNGMNGYQIEKLTENNPLLKTVGDAIRSQGMLGMMNARLAQGNERIGIQKDKQANDAAKGVTEEPLMKQYNMQLGQIGKANTLLNASGPMTHQTASELAQDMGTILANGRAAGLEQSNKQEYASAAGGLASMQQYLTGNPKDALPEPLKQQLRDQFKRLEEGIVAQRAVQAHRLSVGRKYSHNPQAQESLDAAVGQYAQNAEPGPQPTGGGLPGMPAAKAAGGMPSLDDIQAEMARRKAGK